MVPGGSPDDVRRWVLAFSHEAGISITELARQAEISPSTLTRFLKGEAGGLTLSTRTLDKLKAAGDRIARADRSPPKAQETRFDYRAGSPQRIRHLQLELAPSDVEGPGGSENLDLIRPDPSLQDGPGWPDYQTDRFFSIFMPGEFMRPRLRTGERLLIDRLRPASIGSEVLVEFVARPGEGALGTIAELTDRDRSQIRLYQLQHETTGTIHRRDVRNVFAMIGMFRNDVPDTGLQFDIGPVR